MNPETGTFISMDIYVGTLDNLVSLHKYLWANLVVMMFDVEAGEVAFIIIFIKHLSLVML